MSTADELTMMFSRVEQLRDAVTTAAKLLRDYEHDSLEIAHTKIPLVERSERIEKRRQELRDTLGRLLALCAYPIATPEARTPLVTRICEKCPTIEPTPAPWELGSMEVPAMDTVAGIYIPKHDGKPVEGVWLFEGLAVSDEGRANVALILSAPSLLKEARLCLDALDPPRGVFNVSEVQFYANQVEYVKARLQVMVEAATPIRAKGGAS